MKLKHLSVLIILIVSSLLNAVFAQNNDQSHEVSSTSDNIIAFPFVDQTVSFNLSDSGVYKPIVWGLDLAWLDENNVRRGAAFMGGKKNVDVVRSSFMPTDPLVNGKLTGTALTNTNLRINIINRQLDSHTKVILNSDHPSVNNYFRGNAANWAALINETARMHEAAGRTVETVSPFNEPDYSATGQGTIDNFYKIVLELNKYSRYDTTRISGGNTLNPDVAAYWYNTLNPAGLEEGNTHQLAGSFDNYADFFTLVRANGDHATNDELHNVMEAMVGVEYGLQTGIWWYTAEYTRGEFCKASAGRRLAYAEHRPNWTSASVYRAPDGKVQAFGGTSERQAATTSYKFVSTDRDVFFDGHGPQREYLIVLPGGTGYQQGQTNAECVVNITWGDDIQPVIDGKYILINRNSGKVMEVAGGATSDGSNIQQNVSTATTSQQWNVNPVDSRIGGDFSYFFIHGVKSGKSLDVYNWSLDNGGDIKLWSAGTGSNQLWYLQYAEDGWFYIRSKWSTKCIEVASNSASNGANIQQSDVDGGYNQQWRFIPVDANAELEAPAAPANLVVTANAESVRLDWSANQEEDFEGYAIFRAESVEGPYNTIARNIKTTAFVDNTCTETGQYFYKIKAVDHSLNSSEYSEVVEAITTGEHDLIAHYMFNGNTLDSSINLNHGAISGEISFTEGKIDSQAIAFNGEDAFIQLPATLANQEEITVATWVYWNGGTPWQRIFDFSNEETDQYMNLTPRMRFSIKNVGGEQRLNASSLPVGEWVHVAVTLGESGARMYKNGELVDESADITVRPINFKPIFNYIGRTQTEVPFFNGLMDDFRIYNYELSPEEIVKLVFDVNTGTKYLDKRSEININVYPVPANDVLKFNINAPISLNTVTLSLYNVYGNLIFENNFQITTEGEIDVSDLPSGIYLLKVSGKDSLSTSKIVIQH